MADTFLTNIDFQTNGTNIPKGEVSVEQLRDTLRDAKGNPISLGAAESVLSELKQREAKHQEYMRGIHIKHEHMANAGTMAVGGE